MKSIVWRSEVLGSHEFCRIEGEKLIGTAVISHEGQPSKLDYTVECDAQWRTRSAHVAGWIGGTQVNVHIACVGGRWSLNGAAVPELDGCVDVDLNFSPSTNHLPVRRLQLEVGASADVAAAWLRFPSMQLERLEQTYHRVGANAYRYESAGGSFVAEIEVDGDGLVQRYGDVWLAVANATT